MTLELRDRARMVVAQVERELELGPADVNDLVVRAVHANATSAEDTFRLLEAVRLELGLPAPDEAPASAWWLLAGALGLAVWVLAVVGAVTLVRGVI